MTNSDNAPQAHAGSGAGGIDPRLAGSAALRLYAIFRRIANPALMMELRSEHLEWMLEKERHGILFLSGPFTRNLGDSPYNGLTVIRAESIDHARRIIESEPFIARGAMTCDLAEWTIYEGALPVTLRVSDSSATFS